jgi:flagellum-specific peptidoglycan hydrolase FlgJ
MKTRRIGDRFRAYTNAEEGAEDYLSLLDRRYRPALAAAVGTAPQCCRQQDEA